MTTGALLASAAIATVFFMHAKQSQQTMTATTATYTPPPAAGPYLLLLHNAEIRFGIPTNLLVRQAQQESDFNPKAYNAGSGASGIMQLVPRWFPGVDPFDPAQAIPAAAAYMQRLHTEFGSWPLALAAYNWGPGNLANKGFANAPAETQNYVADITASVPVA